MRITPAAVFAFCLTVIVAASIIGGTFLIDSPFTARSKKIDQQKITDLRSIEQAINMYVNKNQQLPDNLDQLRQTNSTIKVSDEEGNAYEYLHPETTSYQLCGTFDLASDDKQAENNLGLNYLASLNAEWVHSSGHYCFTRTPPRLAQPRLTAGAENRLQVLRLLAGGGGGAAGGAAGGTAGATGTENGQPEIPIPPSIAGSTPSGDSPAASGFQQYYKCPGFTQRIGDMTTSAACLAACKKQDRATGCWWLDGTGSFPRDCRICLNEAPVKASWPNDWAITLTK